MRRLPIFAFMKLDILAIGVHPDDIELSCSGTLLRHISAGYQVGLLDLTQGELGTRGSASLRLQEAEEARKRMGAMVRENLGMADGFFQHSEENLRKIIQVLRRYRPNIVLANALSDRHPDHGRAAKLIADACFYSGLRRIETYEKDGGLQEPWRPRAVYHYIQDHHRRPDFVVDISDFMEQKMETVFAFKSQFYDPDSPEPASPISSKEFIDFLYARARNFGRPAGFEFAEGFEVTRRFGLKDLHHLF